MVASGLPASPVPLPESTWEFNRIPGGYETACADLGITVTADEIDRSHGELSALVVVCSQMAGLRTVGDGTLRIGRLNFLAPRSRSEWANALAKRCPGEGQNIDWDGYLERFILQVITAERMGEPSISLRDFVPATNNGQFLIPRFIAEEEVTMWFGDGGTMKSYLMLAAAVALVEGTERVLGVRPARQMRVGIVDWEWSPTAHYRRLRQLCGTNLPDITYIRAERPLVHEVDRLRRIIREEGLGLLALDSVIGACDGPPEQAEVARTFFQAVRQIGLPALAVAHRNRSDDGDQKPFGSTFWHNLARLSWYIEKSQSSDSQTNIALHNRKWNDGPEMQSQGFTFHFDGFGMRTVISPSSVIDDPVLSEKLPLRQRIAGLVAQGPITQHEIASQLGVPLNTVVQTIRRDNGQTFARIADAAGIYRIALSQEVHD